MNRIAMVFAWCLGGLLAAPSWCPAAEGHKTAHGGCLNVIEECSIGHAEVKIEDGTLHLWFVGGDGATTTSVRVAAKETPLLVTDDDGETVRPLTLKAAPLKLAEEAEGDCSHFIAQVDWLKDVESFTAVGLVKFKGVLRVLRIEYPEGFDPDDDDDDHDD